MGAGDFKGGSIDDILWRNSATGDVGIFEMHGGVPTWRGVGTTGLSWDIYGTGDFNADGTTDVLIGTVSNGVTYLGYWQMNNSAIASYSGIGAAPSTWSVVS